MLELLAVDFLPAAVESSWILAETSSLNQEAPERTLLLYRFLYILYTYRYLLQYQRNSMHYSTFLPLRNNGRIPSALRHPTPTEEPRTTISPNGMTACTLMFNKRCHYVGVDKPISWSNRIRCDCVPFHQVASPPGFHAAHIPRGNLAVLCNLDELSHTATPQGG